MLKSSKKIFLLIAAFLSFVFCDLPAFSKDITSLVIKGNERVDNDTIISYLSNSSSRKNYDNFSKKEIDESLKKLYESDLFSDVQISHPDKANKNKLTIEVKENPLIGDVKFIGNKKVEDEALQSEISLKKRAIFTKSKLQSDLKRINEIYLKSGRFLVKIEPKIIPKEQNRIDLIFEIFEGPKATISDIYFVGNDANGQGFTDSALLDELSTKKSKWYKFFSSSDVYDADRIEFDKEKLRRFYGSHGYADFTAISSIAQITPNKDSFFITFLIEEGIKYKMGEINIINHVDKFDASVLKKEILIKKGKFYNSELIDKTIDKMVEKMSEKSYAFANIEPVLKRNKDQKIIDIDFVISETPQVYIDQIHITGNTRTLDEVIRRELRFQDGDPYNITRINRSKQRIQNLAFFEKVEFKTKRIGQSDKVDIEIEVKEKKTGELNLGIGYSTVDKATANAGIKERNLFGTGRELGLNLQKSTLRSAAEINYTKPYFMGRPIDVGFDLSKYELSKRNTLVYDQQSDGITLRGDYSITEFLKHQMRYSFSDETISNVDATASQNIISLQGHFKKSTFGHSLLYDKRDSRIDPKDGYYLSLSQDYTGFGGNIDSMKYEGSSGYYLQTFSENYILKFLVRGGYVDGLGQDVRSNNAFFLGGNSFRGFRFSGVGPRVITNGSAVGGNVVGGNIYYMGTIEFRFPLGLPKELGINGVLFSDNGTVKGVDQINHNGNQIADTGSLRSSYGFALAWSSPLGPISLIFSRTAKKEAFDQAEAFRFSFGTSF